MFLETQKSSGKLHQSIKQHSNQFRDSNPILCGSLVGRSCWTFAWGISAGHSSAASRIDILYVIGRSRYENTKLMVQPLNRLQCPSMSCLHLLTAIQVPMVLSSSTRPEARPVRVRILHTLQHSTARPQPTVLQVDSRCYPLESSQRCLTI